MQSPVCKRMINYGVFFVKNVVNHMAPRNLSVLALSYHWF